MLLIEFPQKLRTSKCLTLKYYLQTKTLSIELGFVYFEHGLFGKKYKIPSFANSKKPQCEQELHEILCFIRDSYSEAVARRCSVKKMFLKISQNSQESTCVGVAWACNFIKKETPTLVLSFEFCEIFKNTFFYRAHPVAASVILWVVILSPPACKK